ncbi:tetratricopeptide repeat protein [Carnobacterium gallinarum]|uniref:tetratricopeptide repeat protein n=1 Tax=Carnobacterium gallinarum TaxID=2749 RepID=UPI000557E6A5|nr:hypothetical protein [Carnobacterium gallinarum]
MSSLEKNTAQIINFIPSSDYYFNLGIGAFQKNDMKRAKKYLARAVTLCKNEEEKIFALCQLAICHQHIGEFNESIEILTNLIEESGDIFSEAYYFQANNYAFLEELPKALDLVETYLKIDPTGDFIEEAMELRNTLKIEIKDF